MTHPVIFGVRTCILACAGTSSEHDLRRHCVENRLYMVAAPSADVDVSSQIGSRGSDSRLTHQQYNNYMYLMLNDVAQDGNCMLYSHQKYDSRFYVQMQFTVVIRYLIVHVYADHSQHARSPCFWGHPRAVKYVQDPACR